MVPTIKLQNTFTNELSFINEMNFALNSFSSSKKKILFLGNFNLSTENPNLKNLLNNFHLDCFIKTLTCYKSLSLTYIDLTLRNERNL